MSEKKYYDVEKHYPKREYVKNDGEITKIKHIRLSLPELEKWDSKKIHDFLSGDMQDETKRLKDKLKIYHHLFKMIIEFYGYKLPSDIQSYIMNHDEFKGGEG